MAFVEKRILKTLFVKKRFWKRRNLSEKGINSFELSLDNMKKSLTLKGLDTIALSKVNSLPPPSSKL